MDYYLEEAAIQEAKWSYFDYLDEIMDEEEAAVQIDNAAEFVDDVEEKEEPPF